MSEGEKQEPETVPPPPPVQDNPRIVEHFECERDISEVENAVRKVDPEKK